jgi:hypothetical protein
MISILRYAGISFRPYFPGAKKGALQVMQCPFFISISAMLMLPHPFIMIRINHSIVGLPAIKNPAALQQPGFDFLFDAIAKCIQLNALYFK